MKPNPLLPPLLRRSVMRATLYRGSGARRNELMGSVLRRAKFAVGLWKGTMILKQFNNSDLVAVLEVAAVAVCAAGATVIGPRWHTVLLPTLGARPVVLSVESIS